jgi:hypothetical protein
MQASEILQVLRTVASVTQTFDASAPYFVCSGFNPDGKAFEAVCNSTTSEAAACAAPGIASCTLHYKDINVTKLEGGSVVRVCNSDWPQQPEQFYAAAYLPGVTNLPTGSAPDVPAKESAALTTLVRAATSQLGPGMYARLNGSPKIVQCKDSTGVWVYTLDKIRFRYAIRCSQTINLDGTRNVTELFMVADILEEDNPAKVHPRMDDFLLYPLLRLQSLKRLTLKVSRPQT